uniref:Ovule protein n=1 Tax=Parastrongyloides trichosuri TaxID=131310 RepID=A0A0N4Z3H7_PARTI
MSFDFNGFKTSKCFMSDSQHQVRLSKKRAKLKITSNGGLHNFQANCDTFSAGQRMLCQNSSIIVWPSLSYLPTEIYLKIH